MIKKSSFATLTLFLALALASSCASHRVKEVKSQLSESSPLKIEVPFTKQRKDECGPNSLFMLMSFYHLEPHYTDIYKKTFNIKAQGSRKTDMISSARRNSLAAYRVDISQSIKALEEGFPVISFHNLGLSWRPFWHYNVLVGLEPTKDAFIVHDGTDAYSEMSYKRYIHSWERGGHWSYIFSPANTLPEFVSLNDALINARIFVKIGKINEATSLYQLINSKHPNDYEASLALSNIKAKSKEYDQARLYIKRAISINPNVASLYYNLALIEIKLNRLKEATIARDLGLKLLNEQSKPNEKLSQLFNELLSN